MDRSIPGARELLTTVASKAKNNERVKTRHLLSEYSHKAETRAKILLTQIVQTHCAIPVTSGFFLAALTKCTSRDRDHEREKKLTGEI
jgi:hypothetical protein